MPSYCSIVVAPKGDGLAHVIRVSTVVQLEVGYHEINVTSSVTSTDLFAFFVNVCKIDRVIALEDFAGSFPPILSDILNRGDPVRLRLNVVSV